MSHRESVTSRSPLLLGREQRDFIPVFILFGFVLLPWMKIAGRGKCRLQDSLSTTQGGGCFLDTTVMIFLCFVFLCPFFFNVLF